MGIKADLSKLVVPKLPDGEESLFVKRVRTDVLFIISASVDGCSISIRRYRWPHPRLTSPNPPSWVRGPGFTIPYRDAKSWQLGIEKLWRVKAKDYAAVDRVALFKIKYSTRVTEYEVRWFFEDKMGTPYYQIQAWEWSRRGWNITKRVVYWPVCDNELGQELYNALDIAVTRAFLGVTDSPDIEIVESKDSYGFDD